jgi:hypothetical protein
MFERCGLFRITEILVIIVVVVSSKIHYICREVHKSSRSVFLFLFLMTALTGQNGTGMRFVSKQLV